jgi:hypothetical protein
VAVEISERVVEGLLLTPLERKDSRVIEPPGRTEVRSGGGVYCIAEGDFKSFQYRIERFAERDVPQVVCQRVLVVECRQAIGIQAILADRPLKFRQVLDEQFAPVSGTMRM